MSFRLRPEQEPHREVVEKIIFNKIILNQSDDRYATYHYPRTKDEWWGNVDKWWTELMDICDNYLDLGKPDFDLIEMASDLRPLAVVLTEWKEKRDPRLERAFSKAWCVAPDHGSIHGQKAWDVLCDLCSESYVLNPEESEPNDPTTNPA